ncbi:type I-E CRISPR-associated protein Cse1/CasA [Streptomyces albidoflavus]|uniref:type I-E CRISPR-associated protein Cse1/CasA n=1 Tax=Streptomyces TaxID=1883 RepID=UPI001EF4A568|nr:MULTISPECIES: type I-E CRISPR-associated protein Cse1/CasA [Streptomyces]MCL6281386.1 type I-E CRISPR-associated protein Cse1/CasA [Streptomyces albidoflavus]WTC46000.1 type I-E CRISPR-associated protein Cse1/CasA [Streptomyces albidoflavus]
MNLLSDGWLSAVSAGGASGFGGGPGAGPAEFGVRELLLNAEKFADIVVDLPTQRPAVFRQVLLPLVVDALGCPKDAEAWMDMFRAGAFSPEQRQVLADYLDKHQHLFGLLDPVEPFGQVADLRTAKGETKGSALLVATAATGNNVPLFSSRTEGDVLELTPAEAARWLLHTHCWDTAAIKTGAVGDPMVKSGKTTGNPTGPLGQLGVTMPVGSTLFETLLLNIPYGQAGLSDDVPQWRRRSTQGDVKDTLSCATPVWQSRPARGLLEAWTWQARRIRLISQDTDRGPRITRVLVAAGDRLEVSPDTEPHTAWVVDSPAGRRGKSPARSGVKSARPRRHTAGRAGWRGLDALLAVNAVDQDQQATATRSGAVSSQLVRQLSAISRRLPSRYPLRVELTGIAYGNQSAVIEDMYFDEIPLPVAALDPEGIVYGALLEVVDQAEDLAKAVNHLSGDLRRAAGSEPIPWDKGQRPGDTLLHALDPIVRRLLAGLRQAGDDFDRCEQGLEAWEHKAGQATLRVAEGLFNSAPAALFTGRRVKKDGKEQVYRLSTAEASFRRRLAVILHRRAAARTAG